MKTTTLCLVAVALTLPACNTTRQFTTDAKSAITTMPRPHLPRFDPPAYPEDVEGLIEYCQAVEARFDYGRTLVGQGNDLLAQGRKMVNDGTFKIRRGEAKIATAETTLGNARRALGIKVNETEPSFGDYKTLLDPDLLSRIQTQLDNGILALERGQDTVEIGEREVADGRARLDRGIDLIRDGQDAMQADEGRCGNLPEEILG